MADILPIVTTLPAIFEEVDVDLSFTADLESTDTFVSLYIIDHRENVGIVVDGSRFHGQYRDSFSLGKGSIKVRLRSTGETALFDSWESLPPPLEADLFEFTAPPSLTTQYNYTVKLVYMYTPPIGPDVLYQRSVPEEREVVKTYTQMVKGDYTRWANRLRNYVNASGNLPKEI